MSPPKSLIFSFLFVLLLAACQPAVNEAASDSTDTEVESGALSAGEVEPDEAAADGLLIVASGDFAAGHLCNQGFNLGFADLDTACVAAVVSFMARLTPVTFHFLTFTPV